MSLIIKSDYILSRLTKRICRLRQKQVPPKRRCLCTKLRDARSKNDRYLHLANCTACTTVELGCIRMRSRDAKPVLVRQATKFFLSVLLCGWGGGKQWSKFTQKKPDTCAEVLLRHEVQTSLTCSTEWMYQPQGQILNRKNDYTVSIYFYGGVKELTVRTICSGVYKDPTASRLRQMIKAIYIWL